MSVPAPVPDREVAPRAAARVLAIVGPTATGKSALAAALARTLGGQIVNADAMQLYRGMDIGTAKPTAAERAAVPHHLLDIWELHHPGTAADYQQRARACLDRLLAEGGVPILVGGSGLYVRAAVDRLSFPGSDATLRSGLEAELADRGAPTLHARLAGLDPAAAAAILPSNGRRIVRALEVIELTGRPFTATLPGYESVYDTVHVGLDCDAAELDARVAVRVEQMLANGLEAEVARLAGAGLREAPMARRALGYQQLLGYLDGQGTLEEAHAETVRATRRFVRRQRSWFRRDPRVRWLDGSAPDLVDRALRLLRGG